MLLVRGEYPWILIGKLRQLVMLCRVRFRRIHGMKTILKDLELLTPDSKNIWNQAVSSLPEE